MVLHSCSLTNCGFCQAMLRGLALCFGVIIQLNILPSCHTY